MDKMLNKTSKDGNSPFLFIGTSHIAKESIDEIKKAFDEFSPNVIAIELDRGRLSSLFSKQKSQPSLFSLISQIGLIGALFVKIGHRIQKRLGNIVGVEPGSEMKQAVLLAREYSLPILLIDQDIRITMRHLSKAFGIKEGFTIFKEIIFAPFSKKERVQIDISKVPDEKQVEKIIQEMKKRYPSLYNVLIEERNRYMKKRLEEFHSKFPDKKILVVTGEGHRAWLEKNINKISTQEKDSKQKL
ncbi:MAG: hypothetical protein PWQ87_385 [Candidatus Woesearchaeota archaeon]|nr:hypothetical protein [Candidatus Woesearchaeota archaeon]